MKTQEKEGRLCSILGMVGGDGLRAQRGCWGAGEPRWKPLASHACEHRCLQRFRGGKFMMASIFSVKRKVSPSAKRKGK